MSTSSETTYASNTSRTATDHKTRTENDYTERSRSTPRSKPAHPCITIRGAGPASGLPVTPTPAAQTRADRLAAVAGWPRC